ncbi:FadR/GntR family transcriptional regulator [Dactylosporangium sp. NPDC048998]|uniref:FadR/GntR family transcriptional regulator n=1 Tax=Dactylosporangium sp. NPDC048998 TaxID=3363976 RepID=UPI00371E749E
MEFVPASRSSVSDHVFGQVRDAILAGAYPPDSSLPSERELAAVFEVNRHAVREALRRLQQLGLVRVAQGGATRVLDWRRHAGLDLAMALTGVRAERPAAVAGSGARGPGDGGTARGATPDVLPLDTLVRDVLEMRACLGADAARLCAERAGDVARDAVLAAVEAYAGSGPDLDRMGEANVALWREIIVGSGNVAYLLAFNSLVGGALAVGRVPAGRRTAELLDVAGHRRLGGHIAAGDPAAAEAQARALLTAPIGAEPTDVTT